MNAYEVLADSTENKKTMIDSVARISTDYHYVTPVRTKAYKLLKSLSSSSSDEDSKKKKSDNSKDKKSEDSTEVTGE